ncbi:hypothetical protein, conserved [Eimeria acervulina]|uniref:Protein RFT1 homolog n=1 Tax=Eimeria acervulina TaxID=5801 RepID=U6GWT4_EIMAC|nr:hypothetical protein, conserved [Eimeria acervulina]CDI83733.1 hypothetical protein, conserved [Eimeria acervulina]
MSYLSLLACCLVSLLSMPVWLYLFLPGHLVSFTEQSGAKQAYCLAAATFAAAGLVDAAAEVLSLRCLVFRSPDARSIAEALSTATRTVLLAAALLMQQRVRPAGVTVSLLMNPMVAFGGSHLCASLVLLQVLWLQCHRLAILKASAPPSPHAAEATAATPLVETPRLLVAWPAFRRLSACYVLPTGVICGTPATARGGSPTLGTPTAYAGAKAESKDQAVAALLWALGSYLSAEHLELLPTYLMLLVQKMLLQHGEQLLLLFLLDKKAAAEYAVTSGAASVLCRVVFSHCEAAAFEGFCVLQKQPAAVAATDAAPAGAAFDTGRLPGMRGCAAARANECNSVRAGKWAEQHLRLRRNALCPKPSKKNHRLCCEPQQQEGLPTHHCSSRIYDTEKGGGGHGCSSSVTSILGSRWMARLLRRLDHSKLSADQKRSSSHSPALALLQLLLLLQGTLGLAAAAGGCLFAAPALRCVFGPSTVAPGSGFIQTLQVYCCYVCCLSFFGLLDAYATASCSSGSLGLLKRRYLAVTAVHLALLLPLSIRVSAVFGIPAGAGAAAAQVVAAVLRIGCCCLAILKDLGETPDQCPVQKLNALGCSASSQQLVPQDFSDCSNKKRSEGSKITTAFNASRGLSRQAGPILSYAKTARRWNREALAAIWTLLPPGAASLALRYSCCIVAATAARSILRQASFEFGEGTAAAAGK